VLTIELSLNAGVGAALERLAHARRVLLQRLATEHGLSPLQVESLLLLIADTGLDRVGMIASELGLAGATVTDAVAALERKGLVKTQRDRGDGRRRTILLTPTGRRLARSLARQVHRLVPSKHVLEADAGATLKVLLDLIGNLYDNGIVTVDGSCQTCQHFTPAARSNAFPTCALLGVELTPVSLRARCPEHQLRPPASPTL
jgi:DNA-binding MarR family transcriptional regulator